MKNNIAALAMAGILAVVSAAPYTAWAKGHSAPLSETVFESISKNNTDEAPERIWNPDFNLTIERENDLIEESGLSIDAWDAQLAEIKKEAFADPFSKEALVAADPEIRIHDMDGRIFQIDRSSALPEITNAQEAYRLACRLIPMLGGSQDMNIRLWHELRIGKDTIYCFQQIADSAQVTEGMLKIAADENGTVSGIFSSLDPDQEVQETLVTGKEAEEAVRAYLENEGKPADILSEYTSRIIHGQITIEEHLQITDESSEEETPPEQLFWVVYTPNVLTEEKEYPYLANYVRLDGTYLYNLPVAEIGSREALQGCRMKDVFAGMIPGKWTGEVKDGQDEAKTITVPVMYSESDGKWYLGDTLRRIAVADHASAAYNEDHDLVLASSKDNKDWDNEDLYMFYNYIKAWDFYADMGWICPDGEGSDVIILKDLCLEDGTAYANACSIGRVSGLQMFGYAGYDQGEPLKLVRALDVMAHEYTHTFTSTVMGYNMYKNDLGAINEAMSDIMGNIIEQLCHETDDSQWLLGENTGDVFRSMSSPRDFQQPEYVWDVYYGAPTENPNDINDSGGVHYNSSLLNKIAARLCMDYGMSPTEAASFWIRTACGMTPMTDYPRMGALLDWALEESCLQAYAEGMHSLIRECRLDQTELPETLPSDQKLIKLQYPETEVFEDDHWVLLSLQLNTETIAHMGKAIIELGFQLFRDPQDYPAFNAVLQELLTNLQLDQQTNRLKLREAADGEALLDNVTDTFFLSLNKLLIQNMAWEYGDSGEVTTILNDFPTLYVLLNLTDSATKLNGAAVLLGSHWYDIGSWLDLESLSDASAEDSFDEEKMTEEMISFINEYMQNTKEEKAGKKEHPAEEESGLTGLLDTVMKGAQLVDYLVSGQDNPLLLEKILSNPAKPEYLPTNGLEKVTLLPVQSE